MSLDYAIKYTDKLKELYMNNVLSNREFYKYWNYDSYYGFDWPGEQKDGEWNEVRRVSIFDDKIMGYFRASIRREAMKANSLGVLYFHPNTVSIGFIRDFEKFIALLFNEYHMNKISFICVEDNPALRLYHKYIELHGGRMVGYEKEEVLLTDGKLHDTFAFEIMRRDWKEKI